MTQITVEAVILNQTYLLTCDAEEEQALNAAVSRVNAEMESIRDGGTVKAKERIAVLAALNLAHALGRVRLAQEQAEAENIRLKVQLEREEARPKEDMKLAEIVKKLDVALEQSGFARG